jgi:hypothetical protein
MRRTQILKNILFYLFMPENTTEAGGRDNLLTNPALSGRQAWLGPLKTVFWAAMAIVGPVLLFALSV